MNGIEAVNCALESLIDSEQYTTRIPIKVVLVEVCATYLEPTQMKTILQRAEKKKWFNNVQVKALCLGLKEMYSGLNVTEWPPNSQVDWPKRADEVYDGSETYCGKSPLMKLNELWKALHTPDEDTPQCSTPKKAKLDTSTCTTRASSPDPTAGSFKLVVPTIAKRHMIWECIQPKNDAWYIDNGYYKDRTNVWKASNVKFSWVCNCGYNLLHLQGANSSEDSDSNDGMDDAWFTQQNAPSNTSCPGCNISCSHRGSSWIFKSEKYRDSEQYVDLKVYTNNKDLKTSAPMMMWKLASFRGKLATSSKRVKKAIKELEAAMLEEAKSIPRVTITPQNNYSTK
nr:MAG: hypothetical protein [Lanius cristatus ambidensovirus]